MVTCRHILVQSKKTLRTRQVAELPLWDRVALALLFIYVLSDVMGGAARYYSVHFGAPWLPYLPTLALLLALAPMFFAYAVTEGISSTYLTVLVLFGVAATFGVFNLGNASQVEFGFWTLVPFLYGIVVLPSIMRGWRRLIPYAVLLWTLAVAGVLINFFHSWPWIGFEYQVGAASIHASRFWNTGGLNFLRLPGFSEASFFVAPQILLLAVFLRETLPRRWRIPMWALSGLAILLTTSKTAIITFILFSALWILFRGAIRPSWRLIPMAAACLDIALPFSMLLVKIEWLTTAHSKIWSLLIVSFVARMELGWPDWIRMAVRHGNWILGRGLGGIGPAQAHFEPWLFSPSDNMAVFVFASFGLLGLVWMLHYGWKASRLPIDGPMGRFFFLTACVVLLGGVTLSVMDATALGLAFGVSLRYIQEQTEKVRSRAPARHRQRLGPLGTGSSQPACT
jgi:hypothetical protein